MLQLLSLNKLTRKFFFKVFSYYFYFVWYKNAGILCKDNNYFRK
ncbi:hypothetical protein BOVA713_777 [Bacteroides ovatus]|uniref:Uncharacterized protein n=1 Tax=Bacteroides ovatus (strain ATCC 8483 / DSM 1896 / JCM 5824 / BCRC 10623 / CCUG 4943 / NCTC 11153) TaxID=411476 RepID=A0AAN3A3X2_BACO1|nr:hypothetical protein BACOVA_05355 [Bacteroides ovatus ATCC 8483]CAG9891584.1 hypothetical protein BOVA713_777 [Bacteroides ovatus]